MGYYTFYVIIDNHAHICAYGYVVTQENDIKHIVKMIKGKMKDPKNKKIEIVSTVYGRG